MPLGRQLSKLFNPGPAKSYDPNREALFAQLLSSGSGQPRSVGSAIGDLAKFFVGQRGLKKQGQARDIEMEQQAGMEADQQAQQSEALARLMGGLGIDVDSADAGILQQNPNIMSEVMQRTRPQEPKAEAAPRMVKGQDGANYWATGPEAGQRVLPDVEAPPEPEPDRKMLKGADGFNYYTDTGERVLPGVEAAASGPQTVVNVTNQPDIEKSTKAQLEKKLIQSRESLGRMDQIVAEFDPIYLTIGDKVETAVLGWQEKVGMTLDPAQKKALAARATFFQKTYDSVNRTIRDMTGAQMNEHEAGRLKKGMPNQDDSPTEFMAKMQSVIGQIKSYDRLYRETMGQGLGPAGEAAPQSTPESDPLGLF